MKLDLLQQDRFRRTDGSDGRDASRDVMVDPRDVMVDLRDAVPEVPDLVGGVDEAVESLAG